MATNMNLKECGWFYHAPAKKKETTEPIEIPITSQIPGLSDLPPEFDDKPKEMYFKETDTKYIRMAKQGGRKDLLVFKDHRQKRDEPKGYPRVDWFYLEDNAAQDAHQKKELDWQFLLPEYMVHETHQQPQEGEQCETEVVGRPRRAPYAFDSVTAFEREGDTITDKTVKLPEIRPPGYGVRINKPLPQAKKQGGRDRTRNQPPASSVTDGKSRQKNAPKSLITKPENAHIDKLLSYEYDKEWHARLAKQGSPVRRDDVSEYTENYRKLSAATNHMARNDGGKEVDSVTVKKSPAAVSVRARQTEVCDDREPFKLSKFKNVPARIDTHQKPDSLRKQN